MLPCIILSRMSLKEVDSSMFKIMNGSRLPDFKMMPIEFLFRGSECYGCDLFLVTTYVKTFLRTLSVYYSVEQKGLTTIQYSLQATTLVATLASTCLVETYVSHSLKQLL